MGFLSDPKYMSYKGFQTVDTADPYFELMYLPFDEDISLPCFRDSVGRHGDMPEGFVLYYTKQCPFTAKYVPILEEMAKAKMVHLLDIAGWNRERKRVTGCLNYPTPYLDFGRKGGQVI